MVQLGETHTHTQSGQRERKRALVVPSGSRPRARAPRQRFGRRRTASGSAFIYKSEMIEMWVGVRHQRMNNMGHAACA